MWNRDFATMLGVHTRKLNALESGALRVLQFSVRVPAAVYARYYFLLRGVAVRLGLQRVAADQLKGARPRARARGGGG